MNCHRESTLKRKSQKLKTLTCKSGLQACLKNRLSAPVTKMTTLVTQIINKTNLKCKCAKTKRKLIVSAIRLKKWIKRHKNTSITRCISKSFLRSTELSLIELVISWLIKVIVRLKWRKRFTNTSMVRKCRALISV